MSPALTIRLYEGGCSVREVAAMADVSYSTMRRRLFKVYGCTPRSRGGNPKSRCVPHAELAKTAFLYTHVQLSQKEVGEVLGLDQATVQARLARSGVETRSKGESTRLRWARRPKSPPRRIQPVSLEDLGVTFSQRLSA